MKDVKTLGAIPMQVPKPMKLIFASEFLPDIIKNAVVLSLLGGIDSLLTSLVCDNITNTYHDSDKEMIGQVSIFFFLKINLKVIKYVLKGYW